MALKRDPIAFPKLDDEQVSALAKFATLKSFAQGETLFAAGELDFKFFVVKSGQIAIVDRSGGNDEIITIHEPGEFTGDVDMLTGRAVLVSAVAHTPCEVSQIEAADLRRILNEMPPLSDILLRAFLMRRQLFEESGAAGVRVVGSHYSCDTHHTRGDEQGALHLDGSGERSPGRHFARAIPNPSDDTPVVICGDATILRNPSNAEVADCLGIRKPLNVQSTISRSSVRGRRGSPPRFTAHRKD